MTLALQYDAIYTGNPAKWNRRDRDRYAMNVLNQYLSNTPKTLLDIGCGSGHTLEVFSHYWRSTELYGIDLSQVAIATAGNALPGAHLSACTLLEYAPGCTFEAILCMGTMEHFEDIPVHLAKMASLLADGGIIYAEVPHNLAYSDDRSEGFRGQGPQTEWHLKRQSWENVIRSVFDIERTIIGPYVHTEFIWILKHKREP